MAAASPRAPASPRPSGLGPRTHSPVTNNIRQRESGRVRQRHLAQLSSPDQKQRSGGTSFTRSRANSSRADVQAAYEALYYEGGFDTKEDADDMVSASLKRRFRAASYRLGGQDWEFLFSTCALSLRRALAALRAADSAPRCLQTIGMGTAGCRSRSSCTPRGATLGSLRAPSRTASSSTCSSASVRPAAYRRRARHSDATFAPIAHPRGSLRSA